MKGDNRSAMFVKAAYCFSNRGRRKLLAAVACGNAFSAGGRMVEAALRDMMLLMILASLGLASE